MIAKYCTKTCRNNAYAKITGRLVNRNAGIPSGTVGAIAEMIAGADLMRRGYSVFRALSPACFCDLVAIKEGVKKYVEVRTGYINIGNGNLSYPKITRGEVNCFAIWERNSGEVFYRTLEGEPIDM